MAPDSPQKITKAATAIPAASGLKSCWPKTSPPKTNRFFTHCRGRSETRRAVSSHPADRRAHRGDDAVDLAVGHLRIARQGEHLARRPTRLGPLLVAVEPEHG